MDASSTLRRETYSSCRSSRESMNKASYSAFSTWSPQLVPQDTLLKPPVQALLPVEIMPSGTLNSEYSEFLTRMATKSYCWPLAPLCFLIMCTRRLFLVAKRQRQYTQSVSPRCQAIWSLRLALPARILPQPSTGQTEQPAKTDNIQTGLRGASGGRTDTDGS